MKYSELIELYTKNKLSDEQKTKVEFDIDRQKAISDYLFESEEIPEFGEEMIPNEAVLEKSDDSANEFTKMINRSVRRAFVKMGIAVGAVVMAVVLLAVFVMPKLVDTFFYDPAQNIPNNSQTDRHTNRISLDMAVYSELFLPGYYRDNVVADRNGYGSYDINILQSSSITGRFTNIAGKIEQNKLTLYDPNLLKHLPVNVFAPAIPSLQYLWRASPYDKFDSSRLTDNQYYIAYITLDDVLNYAQFTSEVYSFLENEEWANLWCALCRKQDNVYIADDIEGFIYSDSCTELLYDDQKYPYLSLFDTTFDNDSQEEVTKKHIISMLRYMRDESRFDDIADGDNHYSYDFYSQLADSVEKDGIHIYGFAVTAKKDTILKIEQAMQSHSHHIAYISTTPYSD